VTEKQALFLNCNLVGFLSHGEFVFELKILGSIQFSIFTSSYFNWNLVFIFVVAFVGLINIMSFIILSAHVS
jgi:hypothetical protein